MILIDCTFCQKKEPKDTICEKYNIPFYVKGIYKEVTIPYNTCEECRKLFIDKFREFLEESTGLKYYD